MNIFFQQLFARFNRLTYSQRFNVVTFIFILPVLGLLPLITNQITRIDTYGRKEILGTLYLRAIWQLTEDLQHYDLTYLQLQEGEATFADLDDAQGVVDASFANLISLQAELRANIPLNNEANELLTQWESTKSAVARDDTALYVSNQLRLYNEIGALRLRVGDISNLILDPELNTYYLMEIVLQKLPENQAYIFEVNDIIQTAEETGVVTAQERQRLVFLSSLIQENIVSIKRDIEIALKNDPTGNMSTLVAEPNETYQSALQDLTDEMFLFAEGTLTDEKHDEFDEEFISFQDAGSVFYDNASKALEEGISARNNQLIFEFYVAGLIAFASIALAFSIGQTMMQSISQPLAELATATQQLAIGDLSARVDVSNAEGELGQVALAFNNMARDLEKETNTLLARSQELENANRSATKRAQELRTISEISRIVTSEQNLKTLLPLVTQLISEKFGYYHVGIFLVEGERRQSAVLQAANSDGGKVMLKRNHRLELGQGVVGFVAATGTPRIALDVGIDSVYFNNPDLPETHSEMALPLRFAGVTIGVLDVQSIDANAFQQEDIETLSTLADQVAIAIQNARSYETTSALLEQAQQLSGSYVRNAWSERHKREQEFGYVVNKNGLQRVEAQGANPAILSKLAVEDTLILKQGERSLLAVPIRVAGQVVGSVHVQAPVGADPSSDEADIVRAVADRLSLALESATLLEATQKRANFERVTSDIIGKISSATQYDAIIRTAAEELSRALGGSEVMVQIQSEAPETQLEAKQPHV